MFQTFDRYLYKRFFYSTLGGLSLLVVVLVAIDVAEKIDDYLSKNAPLDAIITYYQNFLPFFSNLLLPLVVFLGVLFFTAKMAQNNEILALWSTGVSYYRILRPYLIASCVLAGGSFYLGAYVVPYNAREITRFEYQYVKDRIPFDKRQIHLKLSLGGYFFCRAYDKFSYQGYDVVLDSIREGRLVIRWQAKFLRWEPPRWRLESVEILPMDPSKKVSFQSVKDTALNLLPDDLTRPDYLTKSYTLSELIAEIREEKLRGGDFLGPLKVELHERFAFPISSVILTVMGYAFAARKKRGGVALQLGLGLVLAFIYVFLLVIAKSLTALWGTPEIGVWFPNVLYTFIALSALRVLRG
ncbi:MAG: LptF/LptG family permease [Bacteroidia bacterium]